MLLVGCGWSFLVLDPVAMIRPMLGFHEEFKPAGSLSNPCSLMLNQSNVEQEAKAAASNPNSSTRVTWTLASVEGSSWDREPAAR